MGKTYRNQKRRFDDDFYNGTPRKNARKVQAKKAKALRETRHHTHDRDYVNLEDKNDKTSFGSRQWEE